MLAARASVRSSALSRFREGPGAKKCIPSARCSLSTGPPSSKRKSSESSGNAGPEGTDEEEAKGGRGLVGTLGTVVAAGVSVYVLEKWLYAEVPRVRGMADSVIGPPSPEMYDIYYRLDKRVQPAPGSEFPQREAWVWIPRIIRRYTGLDHSREHLEFFHCGKLNQGDDDAIMARDAASDGNQTDFRHALETPSFSDSGHADPVYEAVVAESSETESERSTSDPLGFSQSVEGSSAEEEESGPLEQLEGAKDSAEAFLSSTEDKVENIASEIGERASEMSGGEVSGDHKGNESESGEESASEMSVPLEEGGTSPQEENDEQADVRVGEADSSSPDVERDANVWSSAGHGEEGSQLMETQSSEDGLSSTSGDSVGDDKSRGADDEVQSTMELAGGGGVYSDGATREKKKYFDDKKRRIREEAMSHALEQLEAATTTQADRDTLQELKDLDEDVLRLRLAHLMLERKEQMKLEAMRMVEGIKRVEENMSMKFDALLEEQRELAALEMNRTLRNMEQTMAASYLKQYNEQLQQNLTKQADEFSKELHKYKTETEDTIRQALDAKQHKELLGLYEAQAKDMKHRALVLQRVKERINSFEKVLRLKQSEEQSHIEVHRLNYAAIALAEKFAGSEPIMDRLSEIKSLASDDELIREAVASIPAAPAARGIPTLAQLRERFATVKHECRRVALVPSGAGNGIGGHIVASVLAAVTTGPVGMAEGDSTSAILARADHLLKMGELRAAVTEVDKLEGLSARTSRDWLEAAKARVRAEDALKVVRSRASLRTARHLESFVRDDST